MKIVLLFHFVDASFALALAISLQLSTWINGVSIGGLSVMFLDLFIIVSLKNEFFLFLASTNLRLIHMTLFLAAVT